MEIPKNWLTRLLIIVLVCSIAYQFNLICTRVIMQYDYRLYHKDKTFFGDVPGYPNNRPCTYRGEIWYIKDTVIAETPNGSMTVCIITKDDKMKYVTREVINH